MRPEDEAYFERLEDELDRAFEVAETAKQRGEDPVPEVEIPTARDMADRVENILGIDGVAERVRELEGEYSREEAALELVEDFVEGRVGSYESRAGKIEGAVRTAVALLTEGVVAAPIEGIDRVELLENDDGTEFVTVAYAGPIRSAGGTAQALSVLVADYARALLDVDEFKPRDEEVERYAEEVQLYDKETGLQYTPKDEETKFITEHCPVMLDGEATSDEEVSGFRDLERIDTNAARGGMCLVLAEGIALKAPKIQRYTRNLEEVDWPWLQDLIDGTIGKDDGDEAADVEDADGDGSDDEVEAAADAAADGADAAEAGSDAPPRAEPSKKFLRDLIAGRPVFGHPSEPGGFRLRYGRTRNLGDATAGVHPATMRLVDDFLAPGTQIKTELPGKAAGVVPVDSIEGPTVRLANGDVRRIDDAEEALAVRNGVEAVLDLGEYLVNYGEFVENNHSLVPAAYAAEWWIQDLEAAGVDVQALQDDPSVDLESPAPETALAWAREHDAPLHPAYTYCWHDLDVASFELLADAVASGRVAQADGTAVATQGASDTGVLVLEDDAAVRAALETLLVEHSRDDGEVTVPTWKPLALSLGLTGDLERTWETLPERARTYDDGENAVRAVNAVAPFEVREKAPTRVGCRMGRPEKSEDRELSPAVHALYPIGDAGGDQRDVAAATHHADTLSDTPGEIPVEIGVRKCHDCDVETHRPRCPDCGEHVEPHYTCPECDVELEPDGAGRVECPRCELEGDAVEERLLDVATAYREALENVGEREHVFDVLKGVKGLTSELKTPEPLEKGVLRAKHGVSAFKDGTVRYDMTDLPVTAVKPAELDVSVDQFHALGYEEDVHGDPLTHAEQVVELNVQDVILSEGAAEHMLKTADFVDDLLVSYYDVAPYYELEERDDLVGELVFGMAPHTSAAVVGRIVGFSSVAGGYAHPYFHAAKRRNCFHPDTKFRYEDEAGSQHYRPIEEFVERRLEDPVEDDVGTLVQELDGEVRVPSVTDDGSTTTASVEAVSKHPAPDHLVRIETRSGRELTVTPDHTMLVWAADEIREVPASELEPGAAVPAIRDAFAGDVASDQSVAPDGGGPQVDIVRRAQPVPSTVEHTYCVTVAETHRLVANGLYSGNCDGDEDCVMLLLDGLLNFSKQFLPDQRGGSVAEDSRLVAVDPDGDVRFLTFDEFWDELETDVVRDGKFYKKPCLAEGWETYAFDGDHRAGLQPIEKAIRYRADDEQLLRIQTQFGRSIDITDRHSLFRYDDGIEEVAGDDLSQGDLLVAPQQLDVEAEQTTIDVAACLDDPYVFLDDTVESFLVDVWESAARGSDVHAAFDAGLSYRLSKGKISLDQLEQIAAEANEEPPLRDATLGLWGSEQGIDTTIDVDEEFAWLLGMFVAEGSLSGDCPTVFNSDEELIDRVVDVADDTIGVEPSVEWSNKSYRVHFPAVLKPVLFELGFEDRDDYSSCEKVVPEPILRADRDVVLAFLRGLLCGDGSETTDDNHTALRFHTTSEEVKDGVVFLLHRLGLVANVSSKERDDSRQPIYDVAVSGGASNNPLRAILDGDDSYQPKSLVVRVPDALMELRKLPIPDVKQTIPKHLKRRENVSLEKLDEMVSALEEQDLSERAEELLDDLRPLVDGDLSYLRIEKIEEVDYDGYLYDLQVGGDPIFTANWLYAHNSMDAPLVMSSRIDPQEIDDEAHNVDVVDQYPREFYEATRELADPEDVDVEIVEDTLGTDREYCDFDFTHETSDIAAGPDLSAYKTLDSMMDKMEAQLELARTLRSVDEVDVAERVIEYHFLPDLIGNLRAFSRQEVRCLDCGEKFRRAPLSGDCRECGGDVTLTVHEGSVNKYMETAIEVAEEYGCRRYTKQRLEVLERSIDRVFENDKNKASSLDDFM